jgi:hypothetical protein
MHSSLLSKISIRGKKARSSFIKPREDIASHFTLWGISSFFSKRMRGKTARRSFKNPSSFILFIFSFSLAINKFKICSSMILEIYTTIK